MDGKLFVSRMQPFRLLKVVWKLFWALQPFRMGTGKIGIATGNPADLYKNPHRARKGDPAASGGNL
jgi:hypothetical protein